MTFFWANLFLGACTDVKSASIEQYKPTVISFEIQPKEGVSIGDLLICSAEFEDAEGIALRPNYRWTNLDSNTVLGEEAQLLWEAGFGFPNDKIECNLYLNLEVKVLDFTFQL